MRRALAAAAALLLLGATSCETLGGSGASGTDLARYRLQLSESRTAMNRAAQSSDLPAVDKAIREIGDHFDAIESKGSAMNMMDREAMNIQIATGRRTITETNKWIQVSDADAVRSQVAQLDPILSQIDVYLERAVKSSVPSDTP